MSGERPPAGVTALDHTADVGLEVAASDLPQLFSRAAEGMMWLIGGERAGTGDGPVAKAAEPRTLTLSDSDLPALLRSWLRELLFWHETEGLSYVAARFEALEETRLDARVLLATDSHEPAREIKGVTLHGLRAERSGEAWTARVIFDV